MRTPFILFAHVAVAVVAAMAPEVLAQAGPPLLTDDPETPGNRHWEINLAWTVSQRENARLFAIPLLDINYGLGDRVQLKVQAPWLLLKDRKSQNSASGIGSTNLGLKWRFVDKGRHGLAMSVYPQLEIRTSASSARRGLIEPGSELLLPIEMSHPLGPVTIDAEIGYQFVQHEKDEFIYGFAVAREINNRLELLGEFHGEAKRDFSAHKPIFNIGGRFKLSKHYTLLFSSGRTLRRASSLQPTLTAYAGLQFNF